MYVCVCCVSVCMHAQLRMVFVFRRKKVADAATTKWPGNDVPILKNNPKNLNALDELVDKLVPECQTRYFGRDGIHKHILDTFNECRRQIRKGHDYENVRHHYCS